MRSLSILTVLATCSAWFAVPALAPSSGASIDAPEATPESAPAAFHPHFQKRLTCRLARGTEITVTYQTVTFDAAGAEKLAVGRAWHLANTHLETTGALTIGGHEIEPGRYALKARKAAADRWELVLDTEGRFSSKVTDAARALETVFTGEAPLEEHLSVDVHPAGDGEEVGVWLEVHFDKLRARAAVALPAQPKDAEPEVAPDRKR